jgi:hypothetical protein
VKELRHWVKNLHPVGWNFGAASHVRDGGSTVSDKMASFAEFPAGASPPSGWIPGKSRNHP